jgi:hypothetical protein
MKISEVIEKLNKLKNEQGDLPLFVVESSWVCEDGNLNVWDIINVKMIPEDDSHVAYIGIIV